MLNENHIYQKGNFHIIQLWGDSCPNIYVIIKEEFPHSYKTYRDYLRSFSRKDEAIEYIEMEDD